jgi:hypothetical protein
MRSWRVTLPVAAILRSQHTRRVFAVCAALVSSGAPLFAQRDRDVRVEVVDATDRGIPDARIELLPAGDSAVTDSLGKARLITRSDSAIVVIVRKLGYARRSARFVVGNAPAFRIRVQLGTDDVQQLAEVRVVEDYLGEPWREGYEYRKKRASGSFRDRSYFGTREPLTLNDWFNGLPGVFAAGRGFRINRCPRLGVWIDGMHVTAPGLSSSLAMQQLTPTDIAAIEVYRTAQQQSQYSDPNREDCSLLVWTRGQ